MENKLQDLARIQIRRLQGGVGVLGFAFLLNILQWCGEPMNLEGGREEITTLPVLCIYTYVYYTLEQWPKLFFKSEFAQRSLLCKRQ